MGRLILTLILFLSLSVKAQEALDKVRDFLVGWAMKGFRRWWRSVLIAYPF